MNEFYLQNKSDEFSEKQQQKKSTFESLHKGNKEKPQKSMQPSQNQPVTGSTSHLLWGFDRFLPVRKYIYDNDETISWHAICHLTGCQKNNKLCDNFWRGDSSIVHKLNWIMQTNFNT